jgi:hypothetical protein
MAKTTSTEMDALHGQLAKTLKDAIEEAAGAEEKKGLAALLNVARQFLKDNDVTASVVPGSPLAKLTENLPFLGDEFSEEDGPVH